MTNNLEAYRCYSLALEKAQALHNAEVITLLERRLHSYVLRCRDLIGCALRFEKLLIVLVEGHGAAHLWLICPFQLAVIPEILLKVARPVRRQCGQAAILDGRVAREDGK